MSKTVIMFPMNDDHLQNRLFEGIRNYNLDQDSLHFVHIFEEVKYPYVIPPYIYPAESEKGKIAETVEGMMKSMVSAEFKSKAENFQYTCLFSENPKVSAVDFLDNENSKTVVCATREKGNFERVFVSSFTEYMIKHSTANVLVLR